MRTITAFRRTLSMLLVLALLANQALALTAKGVIGVWQVEQQHLSFWWHTSGWAAKFNPSFATTSPGQTPSNWDGKGAPSGPRPAPQVLEKKEDRARKVVRVEVFPGDITLETGQQAVFNAVARDNDGAPISGLEVTWEGLDEGKGQPITLAQPAVFAANTPGKFKITADIAGHKGHVKVTVVGVERAPNITSSIAEPVSSHDQPKKISSLGPATNNDSGRIAALRGVKPTSTRRPLRAAAAGLAAGSAIWLPGEDDYGWNSSNYTTIDDPGTERGNMPGHALDEGSGSGDFQFAAPLLNLDGRGIDLNLAFHYNSRLWHKSGSEMYFDADRDWVPGWIFGFGKIVMAGTSYILIDADGTRHSYNGAYYGSFGGTNNALQTFEAYTTDSSYINYFAQGYKAQFDNSGGHNMQYAWAKLPNGTTIEYGAPANYAIYPTKITDANGNRLTITYRTYTRYWNNQWVYGVQEGPNIETVTDSVGRTIQFHYERQGVAPNEKDLLTAVTAPGINGSAARVLLRLQYDSRNLASAGANYGFQAGLTTRVRNNGVIDVIKAIYYPATGTGYWFGDTDSYSNYGMIRKVSERRGMTCSVGGASCSAITSPLTQQPSIGAGLMAREMIYSHTTSPGYSDFTSPPLSDTPLYNRMTEDWAARDTATAPVSKYSFANLGTLRRTTVVRPNGVRVEQDTNNDSNSLYYGLLIEERTYPTEASMTVLHRSAVTWFRTGNITQDAMNNDPTYHAPRPTRTEVTDDRGQLTATDYAYNSGFYNQVSDKTEYGYGGTTSARLHRVHTSYENSSLYCGAWASRGTLWAGAGTGPTWSGPHLFNLVKDVSVHAANDVTRITYTSYSYDESTPVARPDAVQLVSAPTQRGNLTTMKRYPTLSDSTLDETTAVVETRAYDACGNIVTMTAACCEQTSFEFNVGTQYGWPAVVRRGSGPNSSPPNDPAKQNVTDYGYDLNTGLLVNSHDANGLYSETYYQTLALRPEWEYGPSGSYGYHIYDDANLVVYDLAYESGQSGANVASRVDKYLDGHGRVHGEIAYGKSYVMDFVLTKFDNLGRLWQQSRPYRSTPEMSTYEYDELDRLLKVTAPDGSFVQRTYNGATYPSAATNAPGQTVLNKDQWGRERWARYDEQKRLVEIVEPDPGGDGTVASNGMKTSYTYDTLGNLTLATQGSQTRSFKYDGLSRLTHQKLAERDATLNDLGQFVAVRDPNQPIYSGGVWSDVFSYDQRSNLTQRVDARGVKAIFKYKDANGNEDPLNRLLAVQYDKTGVSPTLLNDFPISDAPNVNYVYLTSGDKQRLQSVTVSTGLGNQTFSYDSAFRLAQITQTFTGRESYPLVTSYLWDTLDRMKELSYPVQYGVSAIAKKVEPLYDMANRLDSLKFGGSQFASNPVYNAASQVESLNIGSQVTENYSYDTKTGLLLTQQVKKGATAYLDLKYNYTINNDQLNQGAKTGQLTGITDLLNSSRNKAHVYDKLGRLKEARGGTDPFNAPAWTQSYSYDLYGNRTGVTKYGTGAGSVPLDGLTGLSFTNNRITAAGYIYDPAGNLTCGQTDGGVWLRYRYDSAGRLAQVLDTGNAALETYSYGASNQRLLTVYGNGLGPAATYYAWEGGQVISDYRAGTSSNLVWEKSYVYLIGRLLATLDTIGTKFHHPDRLGTRVVTDATSGTVTTEQVNLPYGTALTGESSGTATTRRFTSYDRSSTTGMDYAVNRFYNAALGRFTQVDPLGMRAANLSDPQSLNLYSYCGNDPINHTDPDGLFFGWLKRFFNAIGKFFSAVARVLSKVLNNKWVSLGFTILGFAVGLFGATHGVFKLLSKTVTKVLTSAINYYNKAKDVAGVLAMAGQVLQGQLKEIGLALVGSLPAIVEDSVMREITNVWHSPQKFSIGAYLHAVGDGFKHGYARLKEVFSRKGLRFFIPVYGFFCGPGYGDSALASSTTGIDGVDGKNDGQGCWGHDRKYNEADRSALDAKGKNLVKFKADASLLGDFLTQTVKSHYIDRLIGVSVGEGYRAVAIPAFAGLLLYRGAYDRLK